MVQSKVRLLLLSIGGGVGHNFLDALGARRERFELVATNSIAEAASSFRCDRVYPVPPAAAGPDYVGRIVDLIRETQPRMVIPCRDDDIYALASIEERGESGNAILLAGTVATARIMNDKGETARFAARHGLPFAPTAHTAAAAHELVSAHGLPLIGKPRSGNASRGVVLLRTLDEIDRAFASGGDLIAQPYLDPPANMAELMAPFERGLPLSFALPGRRKYSVQVFVGPDGAVTRSFGTVSLETSGHATEYRRCDDRDLLELGQAYGKAVAVEGWKGPLNVQLKRTAAGKLFAFEVNGRFTGGTAPRAVLGFDEIGEVMRLFLPDVDLPPLGDSGADVAQSYLCSFPLPRDALSALKTTGAWSMRRT